MNRFVLFACSAVLGIAGCQSESGGTTNTTSGSGASTTTGSTGTGTGACTVDADCPAAASTCALPACTSGTCTIKNVGPGTACADSGGKQCDGAGKCVECLAEADCPAAGECHHATCSAGACGVESDPDDSPCGTAGVCSAGACVGCLTAADCTAALPVCTVATCDSNTCGSASAAAGAACDDGKGGKVCTSAGACVECLAATDCPATGNACLDASCDANACSTFPKPVDTACTDADPAHQLCNDSGSCVECNQDTQCAPIDCNSAACTANACAYSPLPVGAACTGGFCDATHACVECVVDGNCTAAGQVCDTATHTCVAHCTDGVQSGDETGVDCGGKDCWPCQTARTVVISQYGGCRLAGASGANPCAGGASTAGNDEFVELYNPTESDVDVSGWFLQRRTGAGSASCWATLPSPLTIGAHKYLLIGGAGYDATHYGGTAADFSATTGTALTGTNESLVLLTSAASSCGTGVPTAAVDSVSIGTLTDTAATLLLPPLAVTIAAGSSVERKACSNSTADADPTTGLFPGGGEALAGNSFKSGTSAGDWVLRPSAGPRNAATPAQLRNCP